MNSGVQLLPEQASTFAGDVDALYAYLVGVSAFFTALICILILTFGIRYRRGSSAPRENPPTSMLLEITWTIIPLVLAMSMFAWGAVLYFEMRTPPANTLDLDVVGKQWMWKIQHPEGRSEINELHIPIGQPVRLRMISEDVIHSFYVPAFRVKQDVLPGYYTSMWFEANRTGEFHLFCAEYCGTEHSQMVGKVVVMEPDEYADWLTSEVNELPAVAGQRLFEESGCASCHKADGAGDGPSLAGVHGRRVPLNGGGTVIADDQYVRDAILNPAKHIVAGRQPLMPTFQGQLNESDVLSLIAYLRSLQAADES